MKIIWMIISLPFVLPVIGIMGILESKKGKLYQELMKNKDISLWWNNPNKFYGRE